MQRYKKCMSLQTLCRSFSFVGMYKMNMCIFFYLCEEFIVISMKKVNKLTACLQKGKYLLKYFLRNVLLNIHSRLDSLTRGGRSINVYYRSLDRSARETPVDAWAFIRVKGEMHTLPACLNSIVPVIKRGVIAYNPSEDPEEEEFILNFCQQNKGFVPLCYNHDLIQQNSREYLSNTERERHLDSYYNVALRVIPDGEWLIKIDADQIYDTHKLEKLLRLPQHDREVVFLSRLNLDIKDGELYLLADEDFPPFLSHYDHWLVKKRPEMKFTMKMGEDNGKFYAWEFFNLAFITQKYQLIHIDTDLVTWHFPLLKYYRKDKSLKIVPLTQFYRVLDIFSAHISLDMVSQKRVCAFLKQMGFCIEQER